MYILTGGAGFIGSAFLSHLNQSGICDILIVDNIENSPKWKNLVGKNFLDYINKKEFKKQLESGKQYKGLKAIIHLGACSATTEENMDYLFENNYRYSGLLFELAHSSKARFIYASSAATYGSGALGYSDDESSCFGLSPLNRYGFSKQLFDLYLIRNQLINQVVGLKFFNVYGPNEHHKGEMSSMIYKAYHQIKNEGKIKLFSSYHPQFQDGEQKRDFIYVKDCSKAIEWFIKNRSVNGIFNLGCGVARTWNDLAYAVGKALGKKTEIEYIPMPEKLRGQYQYYSCATLNKLRSAGYKDDMTSLEVGVEDYIKNYLEKDTLL
jgi:ADP-L-glycero-D-manno-heptose 6-epimerase